MIDKAIVYADLKPLAPCPSSIEQFSVQLHQVHSRSVQHARNLLPNSIQAIVNRLNAASKRGVDRVTIGNPLLLNHMPVRRALAGVKLSTGLLDEVRTLSQAQSWVERFDVDVLLVHPDSNRNGSELIKSKEICFQSWCPSLFAGE